VPVRILVANSATASVVVVSRMVSKEMEGVFIAGLPI